MMHTTEPELARDAWQRANGRRLLLLLDFDGTLTEFQADPAAVDLPAARREILARLQERATIGVVSGRRLEDVRTRVSLDDIIVAGLHGLEIEIRHGGHTEETRTQRFVHPDLASALDVSTEVGHRLRERTRELRGVFVEDKGASVALHFREALPGDQRKAIDAFAEVTASIVERGLVRIMRGSNVLELLPNIDWNKGSAVRWIVERVQERSGPVFLVYIGDDVTDQDALTIVEEADGLAIAASDRVTARVRLDGPAGVERFLAAL
jgi:trehalose-phosphatase